MLVPCWLLDLIFPIAFCYLSQFLQCFSDYIFVLCHVLDIQKLIHGPSNWHRKTLPILHSPNPYAGIRKDQERNLMQQSCPRGAFNGMRPLYSFSSLPVAASLRIRSCRVVSRLCPHRPCDEHQKKKVVHSIPSSHPRNGKTKR